MKSNGVFPLLSSGRHGYVWIAKVITIVASNIVFWALPLKSAPGPEETSPTQNADVSTLIATGCAYDAWTGSVLRRVTDLDVPGAVSSRGLKLSRTYSSFGTYAGWRGSYDWRLEGRPSVTDPYLRYTHTVWFPDGRQLSFGAAQSTQTGETYRRGARGTNERLSFTNVDQYTGTADLWLEDGSVVHFLRETELSGNDGYVIDYFTMQYLQDPYGQRTTFTWWNYDFNPHHILLSTVTDPSGRSLTFTYNPTTRDLIQVTASTGQWVKYTWQPVGSPTGHQLIQADYSDGSSASYTYKLTDVKMDDGSGGTMIGHPPKIATAQDARLNGPMRSIMYDYKSPAEKDFDGELIAERHYPDGMLVSGYDRANLRETRGDGPSRQFIFQQLNDGLRQFSKKPDFQGQNELFTYDTNNYLKTVTDRRGNVTTYTNETILGRPTRITHPDGTHLDYTYTSTFNPYFVKTATDQLGRTTTHTRDPQNRITRIDYPTDANTPAAYETFTYNNFGQVLTHRMKNGAYEHFRYDARGLLTDKWNATWNAGPLDTDPKTTYTYYTSADIWEWQDRVRSMTNPKGQVTGNEYDRGSNGLQCPGRGLVTKVINPDGTYQSFGYDVYGNKIWQENELRQRTSYGYDGYNRLTSVTNPLSQVTTYSYEGTNGGNTSPDAHTTTSVRFATDPAGVKTANLYDANLRKTSTTEGYGTPLAANSMFGYDAVGNPTTVTDPLNHTTTTTYDNRNRRVTVTNALSQMTTFGYDAASNIINILRPDGNNEVKTYDARNRPTSETVTQDPLKRITYKTYNPSGTLATVDVTSTLAGAAHQITTFLYDHPADLKTRMNYPPPSADYQQWSYDGVYNLATRRTVNGEIQSFSYDNRNRRVGMSWSNGADSATFTYDPVGRLLTAVNPNSTVTRQYDEAGHLAHDKQATAGGIQDVVYTYDPVTGRLSDAAVGVGVNQSYDRIFGYDARGRISTLGDKWRGNNIQYVYDAASNIIKRNSLINNSSIVYGRDNLNRISNRDVNRPVGTLISSETYGYDTLSRLTTIDRSEDTKRDSFSYDVTSQMTSAKYGLVNNANPARDVGYTWDNSGNRKTLTDTGVLTGYTQTGLNQSLNQYGTVGANSVTNGSEHEIASYQGINYSYINDERLKQITSPGNSYQLAYDALGRTVSRTLNGAITYYYYDGDKAFQEMGATLATNVYGLGIDEIVIRFMPTVAYFFYQDHEGSVTHVATLGGVVEQYRYDAFGAPTIRNGSGTVITQTAIGNRFMFTGREYVSQFGIYEYRNRAYHPGLGRFMSEDPKGFDAGDYNLFRYVGNDPLDRTDPMGLGFGAVTAWEGLAAYIRVAELEKERRNQPQLVAKWSTAEMRIGSRIPTRVHWSAWRTDYKVWQVTIPVRDKMGNIIGRRVDPDKPGFTESRIRAEQIDSHNFGVRWDFDLQFAQSFGPRWRAFTLATEPDHIGEMVDWASNSQTIQRSIVAAATQGLTALQTRVEQMRHNLSEKSAALDILGRHQLRENGVLVPADQ